MEGNDSIRPLKLSLLRRDCFLVISKLDSTKDNRSTPSGDHCAVWGCDNDRRYPEKQIILPHFGISRLYLPKNKQDVLSWAKAINRKKNQRYSDYQDLLESFCTRL